ncbi:hypothetical protein DL767_001185 [Monosporascus sp. MG133]|nr:hypothetical protein DL767_001185 [Monosporascus sp. MG133]
MARSNTAIRQQLPEGRLQHAKEVYNHRQRAADIPRPVLQALIDAEAQDIEAEQEDGIQWLMDAYRANGKRPTAEQLALDEMGLSVTSIHSSSATLLSTLYDLIDHPDALGEMGEEIARVSMERSTWDRSALASLRLLASFMKESQRIHSAPEGADAHKFDFASVSDDSLNFGAGFHACPGLFLAQEAIKLIFVHMLTHYDFKYSEEGQQRPAGKPDNLPMLPNFAMPIMFTEIPSK